MITEIDIIRQAILHNEETYKGRELPKRQRGGTDTQIISYAQAQAVAFFDMLNS
jgi:hypothetical protein